MSNKPSRLGKGLESLIPTAIDEFASQEVSETLQLDDNRILDVKIEDIDPNPFQPRREFHETELEELVASIREHGVVQPIILTKSGKRYQLIAGERRWRASQLAGKKTVPSIIRSFDEQQQLEIAVIENIQRAELTVLEMAVAYQKLVDQFNLTVDQIAKRNPPCATSFGCLSWHTKRKKLCRKGRSSKGMRV